MSRSSMPTAARKMKDTCRSALPILLYDLRAANQLLPTAAVLPEQFYTRPTRCVAQHGEVALMRAVLEDAIHCFQKQFVRKGPRVLRQAREAEEWLAAADSRWPFSFVNICAVLGLEPEYVRLGLKQWRERQEALDEDELTGKSATTLARRSLPFAA